MIRIQHIARIGVVTLAWLLVIPCLILLLSAIVPIVPWLRLYAFDIVPNSAPWLFLVSLSGLAIGLATHIGRATIASRNLIAVASVATLAGAFVISNFLFAAERNGARIDLLQTLSTRTSSEQAAPDESRIYSAPAGEALRLDIYRPAGGRAHGKTPVLIFVHGGGFVGGSRSFGAANLRARADRGSMVISVDYRLARPGRPTWDLAISDVRCAMAWVAKNAEALNVDLDKLSLSGSSAGGYLAMAAAYSDNRDHAGLRCGARIPRVAAVMVKAPLINALGSWQRGGELQGVQRSYMTQFIGGTPEQYPDRYAYTNLQRYARAGNPPTLILAGANDALLPAADATAFARKSADAGNRVWLVLFPYSGHDFNTRFRSITNQSVMQIAGQFLKMTHADRAAPNG